MNKKYQTFCQGRILFVEECESPVGFFFWLLPGRLCRFACRRHRHRLRHRRRRRCRLTADDPLQNVVVDELDLDRLGLVQLSSFLFLFASLFRLLLATPTFASLLTQRLLFDANEKCVNLCRSEIGMPLNIFTIQRSWILEHPIVQFIT